jgi:Putative amidoligase enzyme (DUF2126)/Glutamine amidotransferases class-II
VRVSGLTGERHVLLVNGHTLPLTPTAKANEWVAGVRFRAWAPPHSLVHVWTLHPPHDRLVFGDDDLRVDLTKHGIKSRKGVIICSNPLQPERNAQVDWKQLAPGTLLRIRQGAVLAEVKPPAPQTQVQAQQFQQLPEPHRAEHAHAPAPADA